MFRRAKRMMRGGPRRFRAGGVPPALQRAHRLMEEGDYAEAALAFSNLAREAEGRFPERAPFLYFQAGEAAVLNGDGKKAAAHFRSGLALLEARQRYHRFHKAGGRIAAELRERGLNAEADEVESMLGSGIPSGASKEPQSPRRQAILPTHCPSCGAAVRSDEVEWMDGQTAECDYCGSPVRAEG